MEARAFALWPIAFALQLLVVASAFVAAVLALSSGDARRAALLALLAAPAVGWCGWRIARGSTARTSRGALFVGALAATYCGLIGLRDVHEANRIGPEPRLSLPALPAPHETYPLTPEDERLHQMQPAAADGRAHDDARAACAFFYRALHGRYPFSKQGPDAALADVAAFYRPGSGLLAKAMRQLENADEPLGLDTRPKPSAFWRGSRTIGAALFPRDGGRPRLDLEVLVSATPTVREVFLTLDGRTVQLSSAHVPPRWVPLRWPGPGAMRGASLRVGVPPDEETFSQEGEWGLIRLLESALVDAPRGGGHATFRWTLRSGMGLILDIRSVGEDPSLMDVLDALRSRTAEPPGAWCQERVSKMPASSGAAPD